jgi:autotransporter strand-loop-strand O-heptosyltransferase
MIKVRAHTCYLGKSGFAAHSRSFFRALSKHVDLRVRNFTWDDNPHYLNEIDFSVIDQITLLVSEGGHKDFPIWHSFPQHNWTASDDFTPDVDIVLMDNDHYYFYEEYKAPIKIAYAVWESTLLPEKFFQQLLKFDFLWVVSEWHREMAVKQGYPAYRIRVVNEGVDSEFYENLPTKPLQEYTDGRFKFLFFGRWDYRKAVPEVVGSFLKAFPNNEDVDLILSADNPYAVDGMNTTEERLKHYGYLDPRIKVKHFVSREDYVSYVKNGHVMLTCARSEGWNIPLIEAMAAGTPSIYSNYGGQLEFAEGKGVPVRIERMVPANVGAKLGFAGDIPGDYAEPDYVDLVSQMRYCYENYAEMKLKAQEEAKDIANRFSWEKVAADGNKILTELVGGEQSPPKEEAAVIMSHADTPEKLEMLKKCVKSLKLQGYTIIVSSHIDVPDQIGKNADVVIVDRDNPIVYSEEFNQFASTYPIHWMNYKDFGLSYSLDFNHGLAAMRLIKNGLRVAQEKGLNITHCVNYDYIIIDPLLLSKHSEELKDCSVFSYFWDCAESLNSGLFSARTLDLIEALTPINTKKDYFKYHGKTILEDVMYAALKESNKEVKLFDIEPIKKKNFFNQHILEVYPKINIRGEFSYAYFCKNEEGYFLGVMSGPTPIEIEVEYNNQVQEIRAFSHPMYFYRVTESMLDRGFTVRCKEANYEARHDRNSKYANCRITNSALIRDFSFEAKSVNDPIFNFNFVNGPYVEIKHPISSKYQVLFVDKSTGAVVYTTTISNNCWARCNRKYFTDWKIVVVNVDTGKKYEHDFDAEGKNVLISLGSSSLGDSIAWFAHCEEFAKKHKCNLAVSTFKNDLFEAEYPEIKFVKPGASVNDLYASYQVGWFYGENNSINLEMHPRDFKPIPMQATTTDILGLPESTVKPRITVYDSPRPIEDKYVCIGMHSTAQAKYWNNPQGWQDLTDYFSSKGYKVVMLSTEKDGYMGNPHPRGVIEIHGERTLQGTLQWLKHAELFVGVGSGLSWLSWAAGTKTVIISGFSWPNTEMSDKNVLRIFKQTGCNGCFNRHRLDAGDWNWCPDQKNSPRQFECSRNITSTEVIQQIEEFMGGKTFEIEKTVEQIVHESYALGMVQNHSEIMEAAEFFKNLNVKDFIEIGTDQGGTFAIWSKLSASGGTRISLDMPHGNFGRTDYDVNKRDEYLKSLGTDVHMLHGDSHCQCMKTDLIEILGEDKVDFLFIDGDHTYRGVKQDYYMYKEFVKPGGWIAFHDIKDTEFHRNANCRVDMLWNELTGNKVEFVDNSSEYGGIGFIQVTE